MNIVVYEKDKIILKNSILHSNLCSLNIIILKNSKAKKLNIIKIKEYY